MYHNSSTCSVRGTLCLEETQAVLAERMQARGNLPEIRADLVSRVRAEIAAGTYETEEKWLAALDRLSSCLE